MSSKKPLEQCMFCDHTERRSVDMTLHVIKVHGIDFAPAGTPKVAMRPVSCWSCASPIKPSATHCSCGQPKPNYEH